MHDYSTDLKLHHRILVPSLGPVAAPRYQTSMELESNQLLFDLMSAIDSTADGDGVTDISVAYPLLGRTQASVILAFHYGI